MFDINTKIGILGGGQLGKMLCLAAAPLDLKTFVLDTSRDFPAGRVCTEFTEGDFKNFDDVMAFGRDKDVLTIEIEHVNIDALHALKAEGKQVHPDPEALEIIQDKGKQKEFYREHNIPTAHFEVFDDEQGVRAAFACGRWTFPCVQKSRLAGYDGRGVAILREYEDLDQKILTGPCLLEELVAVQAEIAVIVARNAAEQIAIYPAVEMEFHPEANLVEYLLCPAQIPALVEAQAEAIAEQVIETFGICGLLAVEMFWTKSGHLLVNEVAPRPHNSGHHTIDTAATSQFQQHLRAICNLPLGPTTQLRPAVMVNILGAQGFSGPVQYEGLEECLAKPGVYLHLYGKARTSPFRKMGHAATTGDTLKKARELAEWVKENLICKSID